jgi:type IV pilus assembly protein PilW
MRRCAGLTLVEILVAMTLVLVVIAGSTTFITRGRAVHRTSESIARLEEALDAALALLVDEIRLAGYLGLAAPRSLVDGASALGRPERADLVVAGSCGPSLAHDLAVPIGVVDGAYAAAPGLAIGCRPSPDGRAVGNADTLVIRHAGAGAVPAQAGRLQLETNLRSAALSANGSATLGPDARRHDLEVGIYYVSRDATGRRDWPSLRRKRLVGGTRPAFQDEELVSGIADLQIMLGLDDPADADTAIDRWIRPGEPMNGATPRALRIELEAKSDVPERDQPGQTRSKRVSRVVELRNAGASS